MVLFEKFHKGINIGGWLSQYEFIAQQPLTTQNLKNHFDSFITEKDIKQIAGWGFDHIRLPVSGYLLFNPDTLTLNAGPLSYIDQCISWCEKYHLNMVLDLHDLWGNVYGAMDKPMPLLTDSNLQKNFFCIWEQLTSHLKRETSVTVMFELLNEVSDASGYLWNKMYKETIKKIRRIDVSRPLLIGSNCQNSVAYSTSLTYAMIQMYFITFTTMIHKYSHTRKHILQKKW